MEVINKKLTVDYKRPDKNWAMLGGFSNEDDVDYDETKYFYQKRYDKYAFFYNPVHVYKILNLFVFAE